MKSKVFYDGLEVLIETKHNKVINMTGNTSLIERIKHYFEEEVFVKEPHLTEGPFGTIYGTKFKVYKPGNNNFIKAVLIEQIQSQEGMQVAYNV